MITEPTDPTDSSADHEPDDGHDFISPDPEATPTESADDSDAEQ